MERSRQFAVEEGDLYILCVIFVQLLRHRCNSLQIEKSVGQRLQEEVCFDYLMKLMTRQGQLFTKEEYANKILDGKFHHGLIQYSQKK